MWNNLPTEQRDRYKKLITNFASLSEAFAQKESENDAIVAPIINSKFQETAFQYSFNANAEDIGNTSYDASIDEGNKKYLVGIKTFGVTSKDQKIAQFKAISPNWSNILNEIKNNASTLTTKDEINQKNEHLYLELAKNIAEVRNLRIKSSEENLRGFKLEDSDQLAEVEAVYHVLMPSPKNVEPKIAVGETTYTPIDIDNITVSGKGLGCTKVQNPTNFKFSDGRHVYKYTSSDSQLYMSFDNSNIVLEKWPVVYVQDAISIFEHLHDHKPKSKVKPLETHSMRIKIEKYSGFNAFYGQSKMGRKNNNREKFVARLKDKYKDQLTTQQIDYIFPRLEKILYTRWSTNKLKDQMVPLRKELLDYILPINKDLYNEVERNVYRTMNEFELRIPKSRAFHTKYPDFFVKKDPFSKNKTDRTFTLRFLPSETTLPAYIGEDNCKAIKSDKAEKYLGSWVRKDVFQLKDREILTEEKAQALGINGFRLSKYKDYITLEFIWIDPNDEPDDLWK